MRRLTLVLWCLTGCAAHMHALPRGGDFQLVWTGPEEQDQVVITREKYEAEIAEGRHREVKFVTDAKAPILADHEGSIALTLGTVGRFRLNEGTSVQLGSDEAAFEAYWSDAKKVDSWEGDQAKTHVESELFLKPLKAGKGKLKLVDDVWGSHEWEVVVTAPAAAAKK
jgi:hypothetical protein